MICYVCGHEHAVGMPHVWETRWRTDTAACTGCAARDQRIANLQAQLAAMPAPVAAATPDERRALQSQRMRDAWVKRKATKPA